MPDPGRRSHFGLPLLVRALPASGGRQYVVSHVWRALSAQYLYIRLASWLRILLLCGASCEADLEQDSVSAVVEQRRGQKSTSTAHDMNKKSWNME